MDGPTANAEVTSKVDIETRRGHGFNFTIVRTARVRTKPKITSIIPWRTLSITLEFPTESAR